MTTITSDTSIMDILGGGASAKFFGLLEDNNELMEDMDDRDELAFKRQEKILKEFESMSDAVENFQSGVKEAIKQNTTRLKDGVANPINKMRSESITAYTDFTESINEMKDGVSQRLLEVKDGFSTKVDSLKTSFTDAVTATNSVLDVMSVKMEAFSNLPTEQQIILAGKVVADGVKNTISAIPDIISNGMDKLSKGISVVGGFVKSSSGYLKGLFTKSEESDDVGGTSGLSNVGSSKPDADGAGIGSLVGNIIPKGLIKNLGKVGKLAGKLALPLVAIMGIFDFVGGIQDAANIVGKAEDKLSTLEKFGAGMASVISGITLGFIDAKTIFSEGKQVIDSISDFVSGIFDKLPTGIKDGLEGVFNSLFDSKKGIFGSISGIFDNVINGIAEGDWGGVALDILTSPFKMMFSSNGVLANTFNLMKESATAMFSLLPDSFRESITVFADTILGWFDKIKTMASDMIPEPIKKLFGLSSLTFGLSDNKSFKKGISTVKDFLGWGGDDTKVIERKSINDIAGTGTIDKVRQKANNSSTVVTRVSNARIGENNGRTKAITKRRQVSEAITTKRKIIKDSDTATKKSKLVMNRKQDAAPIIVQAPAPVTRQVEAGRTLNTSTTIGDTELAVMNSNMMD